MTCGRDYSTLCNLLHIPSVLVNACVSVGVDDISRTVDLFIFLSKLFNGLFSCFAFFHSSGNVKF